MIVTILISLAGREASADVAADARAAKLEQAADRLSVLFRNILANPAEKRRLVAGELTLEAFLETLRQDPRATDQLSRYWTKVLNIVKPVSWRQIDYQCFGRSTASFSLCSVGHDVGWPSPFVSHAEFTDNTFRGLEWIPPRYFLPENPGNVIIGYYRTGMDLFVGAWHGKNPATDRLSDAEREKERRGVEILSRYSCGKRYDYYVKHNASQPLWKRLIEHPEYKDVEPVLVAPWWDPASRVQICPGLVEPGVCGANLERCPPPRLVNTQLADFVTTHELPIGVNRYWSQIDWAFSMEPAAYLANLVLEKRDWHEAVTGRGGVLTGGLAHFYQTWGVSMLRNAPPGTYQSFYTKGRGEWILQMNGNTMVPPYFDYEKTRAISFPFASALDTRWHPVADRGEAHAGVLTTPAFQLSFNGRRAKAKNAMEAFTCTKFRVDPSVPIVLDPEPDLTKKAYCRECHRVLEPMARFFSRWPDTGETNYFYFAPSYKTLPYPAPYPGAPHDFEKMRARVDQTGSFAGHSGVDTTAFGVALTRTPEFGTCAVERAFEFLMRRPMSAREIQDLRPGLLKVYEESGRRLFSVMSAIVRDGHLLGGAP